MAESGFQEFPGNPWTAIVAPPGTPDAIVQRVNAAIRAALAAPDTKERMAKLNLSALGGSPQDLAARIAADQPTWREVVRASGAKAE
jgi:tripartite-type tricarboxylate transporter receptor subunit TctC